MRGKAITIWDDAKQPIKAEEMVLGRFYRLIDSAKYKEKIGALACRVGKDTVCCWFVHPRIAFSRGLVDAYKDCLFVEAKRFSFCRHDGQTGISEK